MKSNWVEETIQNMSVEQKVGQLVMPSFYDWSPEFLQAFKQRLLQKHIGSVFHYTTTHNQMADFVKDVQENVEIPLLIASDYEQGTGWVIQDGLSFIRPMARGYVGNTASEYTVGKIIAKQARSAGGTMSFSPVVDVNTHPDCPDVNIRAYSDKPKRVIELAAGYIRGMQNNGVLATVKHFPGNGGTSMDQHIGPAIVGVSRAEMMKTYIAPYKKLFKTAKPAAVMVAHLEVPCLCTEIHPISQRVIPASVSSEIITDLLKKELGFEGIVITDATNMGGINNLYSREETAVKAIQAGVDILLDFYGDFERDYEAILQAALSGKITEERLNDAVRRVLQAKERIQLPKHKGMPVTKAKRTHIFDANQYSHILEEMSEKSVTLLKNSKNIIPITNSIQNKKVAILSIYGPERKILAQQGQYSITNVFAQEITKRGGVVTEFEITSDLTSGDIYSIAHGVKDFDLVCINYFVVPSYAIGTLFPHYNSSKLFFNGILQNNNTVLINCFGDPYVTKSFTVAHTILCTFDESPISQKSAAKAIFGEIPIQGKMPVSLAHIFSYGDGIEILK